MIDCKHCGKPIYSILTDSGNVCTCDQEKK